MVIIVKSSIANVTLSAPPCARIVKWQVPLRLRGVACKPQRSTADCTTNLVCSPPPGHFGGTTTTAYMHMKEKTIKPRNKSHTTGKYNVRLQIGTIYDSGRYSFFSPRFTRPRRMAAAFPPGSLVIRDQLLTTTTCGRQTAAHAGRGASHSLLFEIHSCNWSFGPCVPIAS